MTDKTTHTDAPADDLLKALERILPITVRETPDYAELTFGDSQTQAMTLEPDTWLALNELPARIRSLEAQRDEAVRLLREAVPELETYPDEPDNVERAAWLSNGLKRRTAAFLDSLKEGR